MLNDNLNHCIILPLIYFTDIRDRYNKQLSYDLIMATIWNECPFDDGVRALDACL